MSFDNMSFDNMNFDNVNFRYFLIVVALLALVAIAIWLYRRNNRKGKHFYGKLNDSNDEADHCEDEHEDRKGKHFHGKLNDSNDEADHCEHED